MAFTFESIIRLIQRSGMSTGLTSATKLADELMAMHSERVINVENNAFDAGKLAGYEKGYAAGKLDSSEYDRGFADGNAGIEDMRNARDHALASLHAIEVKMVDAAMNVASKIYDENSRSRVTGIRKLYDVTGLGLAKCREIMNPYYS